MQLSPLAVEIPRRQNDILEKEIANISKLHACNNGVWLTNVVLFNNLIHVFPGDGNDTDAILMFPEGQKKGALGTNGLIFS